MCATAVAAYGGESVFTSCVLFSRVFCDHCMLCYFSLFSALMKRDSLGRTATMKRKEMASCQSLPVLRQCRHILDAGSVT